MSNQQYYSLLIAHYSSKNGNPHQTRNHYRNLGISSNQSRGGETGDCALLLSCEFSVWQSDSHLAIDFFD